MIHYYHGREAGYHIDAGDSASIYGLSRCAGLHLGVDSGIIVSDIGEIGQRMASEWACDAE